MSNILVGSRKDIDVKINALNKYSSY